LLSLSIVASISLADEKFDFSAIKEVNSENFATVKKAMDDERQQFMSGKPMNLTPQELKERQRVSVLLQKYLTNPQDPNYKNLGTTKMGTVEDINEASANIREQKKAEALAKKNEEPDHQQIKITNPSLKEFAGKWVSMSYKDGKPVASLYKLQDDSGRFNAELTTYNEKGGLFKKKDTLPLGWQYTGGTRQIQVRFWDQKKTAYWEMTWTIKNWNQEKGRLQLESKLTGRENAKGTPFTLYKCGSPSVQQGRYENLYKRLCS
jgi:hypothetical protein